MEPDTTGRMACRPVPLGELTYTVVDLETTGLKPQGNGITEVCCLRLQDGRVTDRFSTLVNPGLPIPPFIQSMTGITDAMVRDAPAFGEVIPSLLAFLGDSVLVAHNAPFDLSFLNYGLYCHGHRSLHNPVVDTCRLARRLLPGLPRASLDAVTQHLGISVEDRHRAAGDAEATVAVLLRLLALCGERGVESDAQLMALMASGRRREEVETPAGKGDRAARVAVLAERARSLPDAPGVYIMRSSSGRVLYVGKAISLRRRLASYFTDRVPFRTKRLLGQVETIEHLQLGSELEALLEESRLIKQHQPHFNVLLRSYQDFPFIKVEESGPYPRLVVTRELHYDGARYFGPFRNVRETEQALEIVSRCFRLYDDRCPSRSEGDSCLYLQMNRCPGPCLGPVHELRHRQAVEEVCHLLETRAEVLEAELTRRRDAAADRLDFGTAILYRDGMEALGNALARRRLLAPAVEDLNVLAVCPSVHPGWAELFVFGHGRLTDRLRVFAGGEGVDRASVEKLLEAVAHRWADGENEVDLRIDAEKLDQVNIISRWLEDQGDDASTIALGPGWVNGGFAAVVDRVMEAARIAARGVG
ncbi:MAG: exonuclease domain-containing protein [Chloroflexi bacterium]|nr:exonuclease domain-containing protein [Chloroflexota bacterium]